MPVLIKDSLALAIVIVIICVLVVKILGERSAKKKTSKALKNRDKQNTGALPPKILARLVAKISNPAKQTQIGEALKSKINETEAALKQMKASLETLTDFAEGKYEGATATFTYQLENKPKKAAKAAYYLGNLNFLELDFEQALKYYRQAVELEPDNPFYLNEAGSVTYNLGKYEEAIKFFEMSVPLQQKKYGKQHPHIAAIFNNMAVAYKTLGRHNEAKEYATKAYEMYAKTLGENHPITIQAKRI